MSFFGQILFVQVIFTFTLACATVIVRNETNCPAGELPVIQTFSMPGEPCLLANDEKSVYVSFYEDSELFAYKRGSDGLLVGNGYANSVNKSLLLIGMFCSIAQYNDDLLIGYVEDLGWKPNWITTVDKTFWRAKNTFSTVAAGGIAADKYGYIYVNTQMQIVVYNFTNTQPNDTKSYFVTYTNLTDVCGFTITSDDKFYASMPSNISIFNIVRDQNNEPVRLDFVSSFKTTQKHCFSSISFSKSGKLVGVRNQGAYTNLVSVFDDQGTETIYCSPGNVPLNNGCNDVELGYTVLVSKNPNLYIVPNIF